MGRPPYKYSEELVEEIKKLRFIEKKTLDEISEIVGVGRTMIWKILGKSGYIRHPKKTEEEKKAVKRKYREDNKDKIKLLRHEWYMKNRERINQKSKRYYQDHKDEAKEYRKKNKEKFVLASAERRKRIRKLILDHYGGRCACCGEEAQEFLSVDHINGGGTRHRKEIKNGIKGGTSFYDWIVKNEFPEGYRILCHNCNQAFGFYGYCPHNKISETF